MAELTTERVSKMTHRQIVAYLREAARRQREHVAITWEFGLYIVNIIAIHGDLIADLYEGGLPEGIYDNRAGPPTSNQKG